MTILSGVHASNDAFGVQNVFRLPSCPTAPSGLITPNTLGNNRPSRVYGFSALVVAAYPVYLKLYDTAVAPTIGSGTPILTLALDGAKAYAYWNGTAAVTVVGSQRSAEFWGSIGISFLTGIGYTLTKLPADNDATALIAGDVAGLNIFWQ